MLKSIGVLRHETGRRLGWQRASSSAHRPTRATLMKAARGRRRVAGNWIAQRPVALSTHPTLVDEGVSPRHIDLRPFAINDGDEVWVLPGGLTRVALGEGELVVNSSRRWGLEGHLGPQRRVAAPSRIARRRGPTTVATSRLVRGRQRGSGGSVSERGMLSRSGGVALLDRSLYRAGRRHRANRRFVRAPHGRRSFQRRGRHLPLALFDPRHRRSRRRDG